MKTFLKRNNQKGVVAILLTLLIMGAILLIGFGLAAIFVVEIKTSSLIRQSAPAFYAAEAGTEYALYRISHLGVSAGNFSDTLTSNGATFLVCWGSSCTPGACSNVPDCLGSVGKYGNTRRKIDVAW